MKKYNRMNISSRYEINMTRTGWQNTHMARVGMESYGLNIENNM